MLAAASLVMLVLIIFLANLTKKNPGFFGIAGGFLLGFFLSVSGVPDSGIAGGCKTLMSAFPATLIMRVVAVALLFNIATVNGTVDLIAKKAVALVRGKRRLLPPIFFAASLALGLTGCGGVGVTAIMIPIAATICASEGIAFLPVGVLVQIGAWGGGQGWISATGLVCEATANSLGYTLGMSCTIANVICCTFSALIMYFFLGGYKISSRAVTESDIHLPKLTAEHLLTLLVIAAFIVCALLGFEIAVVSIVGVVILMLATKVDQAEIIARTPWSALIMIVGMSMYVSMMRAAGGVDLLVGFFTNLLGKTLAIPAFGAAAAALSFVSDAAGVAIPTLFPIGARFAESMGLNAVVIMNAISVCVHATSISPFSTGGGMVISLSAGKLSEDEERRMFNRMLAVCVVQTAALLLACSLGACAIAIPGGTGKIS